ncbi:alpha/beta fold hydrolase [Clostridium sp. C2-6-12]|uniref:alpha/beta fold hydrolase n=1 Tax=Clostridium sp. C2-6-12 TaxID=2698832 RepID=UPI001371EE47|nr:alpha/beta fold hydrolase [Clostridium sp. C2-6-12]
MNKDYIISKDKAKIVYNITGNGPAIVLGHSLSGTKEIWQKSGWTDILKEYFTVIALDFRGNGESDVSSEIDFYSQDKVISDIEAVVQKCGFNTYNYFGHSYGATIGLKLCKNNRNVKKVVCAGTNFGNEFFKTIVPDIIADYEKFKAIRDRNIFDEEGFTEEDIEWLKNTNLEAKIAKLRAMEKWTGVNINEIEGNLAIFTGEEDIPLVKEDILNNQQELLNNGISLKVFEELNHDQLVTEACIVSPWVLEFLLK